MIAFKGASAPDTTPPTVPTGLVVTGTTTTSVALAWTASTDNVGVTGYKIYRGGVQVGTAYLLCPEAVTSALHRSALKSDAARHTALTNVFTGRPARLAAHTTATCSG